MQTFPKPHLIMSRSVRSADDCGLPGAVRVKTSRNDVPYHFVVHSPQFTYKDYGVHRGQYDRLSFFAAPGTGPVTVHLYDCRDGSPEFDRKFEIKVPADGSCVLGIPPGYAHWFEDLGDVTTRNDYSILAPSDPGTGWDPLHDNATWLVDDMHARRPTVRANTEELPPSAQFLISKAVAMSWRGGSTTEGKVTTVEVGGRRQQLYLDRDLGVAPVSTPACQLATVGYEVGAHMAVQHQSYAVGANVTSGLSETLIYTSDGSWPAFYSAHPDMTTKYSPLLYDNPEMEIEVVDRRSDSPTFGLAQVLPFPQDPRTVLTLEPGVLSRVRGNGRLHYRMEVEVHHGRSGRNLQLVVPVPAHGELPIYTAPGSLVEESVVRELAFG
ncbi:hypothetical protein [Streptomyces sp. M2CJ-2]|uniref:hypothetical protein n=1 Tax=Streptomyces sp. M2CJ-2 TaxID=2803948 RepID=UPI001F1F3769|nr:hypothetical protein [Streptomyces sp. M2CJ-2]